MFCFLDVGDDTLPRASSVLNYAYIRHYAREWTKIEGNSSPGYHILRVFLGVAETIVSSLLCCGVGIVQCLFNLLYYVIGVRNTKKPPILKTKHRSQYGGLSVFLKWFQKRLNRTYGLHGKPGTS